MENFDAELKDHFANEPLVDIDDAAAKMGVTLEQEPVLTKIPEADFAALDAEATAQQEAEQTPPKPGLQNAKPPEKIGDSMVNVGKGMITGTAQAVKNMYHGALDVTDFVSKWAGQAAPETGGARFTPEQLQKMRPPENAPLEQRAGHMIAEYGLPVLTGMGVGGSALRATAIGAGIDFSMMDPNQERLSTMINEKYPEFRDVAVVGNFIHWLGENNPEAQSELEGRFKNMIEGLGVGAAVAGAFNGILKLSRGAKAYQKAAAGMADDVDNLSPAMKALDEADNVAVAAKSAPDAPPMRVRPPTDEELSVAQPLAEKAAKGDVTAKAELQRMAEARLEPAPNYQMFDNNPTIKNVDGSTQSLNISSDILDEVLGKVDRLNKLYKPKTFDDYLYAARLAGMSDDSGRYLANIAEAVQAGRAPTPEETAFLAREILPQAEKNLDAAMELIRTAGTKDDLRMAALNHKAVANRYAALTNIIDKGRSEAGASLNAQKLYDFAFQEADYVKSYALMKNADGSTGVREVRTVPEVVRQARLDARERKKLQAMMMDMYGSGKDADDYANYVVSLEKHIEGLPQGQAQILRDQYKNALKQGNFTKSAALFSEIARKAMLSSFKSPTAAVIGNFITTVNEVATGYSAAASRFVFRDPHAAESWHEANDFVAGLFAGLRGMIFNKGLAGSVDMTRFKKLEMRTSAISAAHWGIDGTTTTAKALEKTGWVVNHTLGIGETLLGKVDQNYGAILEHAALYRQSMKKIRAMEAQGLIKAATPELLAREKAMLLQTSILAATREEVEKAGAMARAAVFSQDLPQGAAGARGAVAQGVSWMSRGPIRQFFFPFMRTGYNIMDYSIQHSLLAPLWNNMESLKVIRAGGSEGAREFAKIMNGTMVVGAAAYLHSQGLITGPPPANPRMRRALEESNKGWKPYSIKVGGEYVDYRAMEPLASMLRAGSMAHIVGAYINERDTEASMLLMGAGLVDTFNPQNLTDELNNVFTLIEKGAQYKDDVKGGAAKLIAEQTAKFLPAMAKDMKKSKDEFRRDPRSDSIIKAVENAWGTQTPWMSDEYAVQRNLWGEPILEIDRLGPDFIIPMGSSTAAEGSKLKTVLEAMGRMEVGKPEDDQFIKTNFNMPSRVFRAGDITINLTNEEYEKYVLYTAGYLPGSSDVPGKEKPFTMPLREAMERVAIPIHDALKGQEVSPMLYNAFKKEVDKVLIRYRKQARDMMMGDPEFYQKFDKARKRAMESRNVGF